MAMKTSSTTLRRLALAALALTLAAGAQAQGVPSDSVLRGFQRNWDYVLSVSGKEVPAAEIYVAERVPAYLILTSAFPSPVMLSRTGVYLTPSEPGSVLRTSSDISLR